MKKLVLLATIVTLFFCSCAKNTTTELTAEQKATIEKEVLDQYDKSSYAVEQTDFNSWSQFWSKNEFVSALAGNTVFPSLVSWVDAVEDSFSRRDRHHTENFDVRVTALTSNLALVTSVGISENWLKNGDYKKSKGSLTLIWKKEQDGWKIIHCTESSAVIEETSSN